MKEIVAGCAHVGLHIKDIERSKNYYTDVPCFTCVREFTNVLADNFAFMKSISMTLDLIYHMVWMNRKDGLFDHIAMQADTIEAVSEDLKAKGLEFEDTFYFETRISHFINSVKYQT